MSYLFPKWIETIATGGSSSISILVWRVSCSGKPNETGDEGIGVEIMFPSSITSFESSLGMLMKGDGTSFSLETYYNWHMAPILGVYFLALLTLVVSSQDLDLFLPIIILSTK